MSANHLELVKQVAQELDAIIEKVDSKRCLFISEVPCGKDAAKRSGCVNPA